MKVQLAGLALISLTALLAQDGARRVSDGVYTYQQAQAGRNTSAAKCATCHGDSLGGGSQAPALVGSEFISVWSGQPVYELFNRIRRVMPLGNEGSLSPAETAQTVAFILFLNGYPPSQSSLSAEDSDLKTIVFEKRN